MPPDCPTGHATRRRPPSNPANPSPTDNNGCHGREREFVWDDAAREAIKDYNLKDLGI